VLLDIDRGGDIIDLARERYVSTTIFIITATATLQLLCNAATQLQFQLPATQPGDDNAPWLAQGDQKQPTRCSPQTTVAKNSTGRRQRTLARSRRPETTADESIVL
jgi:hypothetical protein